LNFRPFGGEKKNGFLFATEQIKMWTSILWTSIITLLIMFLMHQTYNHLQTTLTVPKITDLVKPPEQKYKEINKIISEVTPAAAPEMKEELRSFLTMLRPQTF